MRMKTTRSHGEQEVRYDDARWKRLREMRRASSSIATALGGMSSHLYGSGARGDVKPTSDIDIVVLEGARPYEVGIPLEAAGMTPVRREIVMATPNAPPKCHFVLGSTTTVTVPLATLRDREEDFYRFGGMVPATDLETRVPGVDKRLVLVEPTEKGHVESPVRGRESEVARIVGVSVLTIAERVRVLDRRDEVGRTGVYLRSEVPEEESVEGFFKSLVDRDPVLRKAMRQR